MNPELTFALQESEHLVRQLLNQLENAEDDFRQCAGGEMLQEYVRSSEIVRERLHHIQQELQHLQDDIMLLELQQQIGM